MVSATPATRPIFTHDGSGLEHSVEAQIFQLLSGLLQDPNAQILYGPDRLHPGSRTGGDVTISEDSLDFCTQPPTDTVKTDSPAQATVQADSFAIFQALYTSPVHPAYVILFFSAPAMSGGNSPIDGPVARADLGADAAGQIDWANLTPQAAWDMYAYRYFWITC
jgi:hypothetical protein